MIRTHHRPDAPLPTIDPAYDANLDGAAAALAAAGAEVVHAFGPFIDDALPYLIAFMLAWFAIDYLLSAIIPGGRSGDYDATADSGQTYRSDAYDTGIRGNRNLD